MLYPNCSQESPCYLPVILGLGLLALSSSILCILFSCVSKVVNEEIEGTAFGIIFSL